jgi:hypothetical protein
VSPYDLACEAIDRANAQDPVGHELVYSRRMVEWTLRLSPEATPELLLAVRAQHLRRWWIARSEFPAGRSGYLAWREKLKKFHADALATIMEESGFDEPSVAKARSLILRKNLASDPEGQVLEDAACLVFLQYEFSEFASKTEESKVIDILRKTWTKMSPRGREAALALSYPEREKATLTKALSGSP